MLPGRRFWELPKQLHPDNSETCSSKLQCSGQLQPELPGEMCCCLKLKWKVEHNIPVPDGICALSCTHQAASVRPRPRLCFQLNCMKLQSCGRRSLTPLQEKQAPTESPVQDRPHRSGVALNKLPQLAASPTHFFPYLPPGELQLLLR